MDNQQPQQPQGAQPGGMASQYDSQQLAGLAQKLAQGLGPQGLLHLIMLLQQMIQGMGSGGQGTPPPPQGGGMPQGA